MDDFECLSPLRIIYIRLGILPDGMEHQSQSLRENRLQLWAVGILETFGEGFDELRALFEPLGGPDIDLYWSEAKYQML